MARDLSLSAATEAWDPRRGDHVSGRWSIALEAHDILSPRVSDCAPIVIRYHGSRPRAVFGSLGSVRCAVLGDRMRRTRLVCGEGGAQRSMRRRVRSLPPLWRRPVAAASPSLRSMGSSAAAPPSTPKPVPSAWHCLQVSTVVWDCPGLSPIARRSRDGGLWTPKRSVGASGPLQAARRHMYGRATCSCRRPPGPPGGSGPRSSTSAY